MLSEKLRKQYLEKLGYSYDVKGIKQFQSKYMTSLKYVDGIYGQQTDNTLKTIYNLEILNLAPNFNFKEFRCDCNGRHCCGFPTVVKQITLKNLQKSRNKYGATTVTSAMRCDGRNKELNGSIVNSLHRYGRAIDHYNSSMATSAGRTNYIKWCKKNLPNFNYGYGNCCYNSNSVYLRASYMGSCVHIDFKDVADKYEELPIQVESTQTATTTKTEIKTTQSREAVIDGMLAFAKKYASDNSYKYRKWSEKNKYTHQCPLCHPESNAHATKGWNCRGFVAACLRHGGGIKDAGCSCSALGFINATYSDFTLEKWQKINGKKWTMITNGGKTIPKSKLKKGDVLVYLNAKGGKVSHWAMYYGDGKVADATSGNGIAIRKPASYGKVAFRPHYTKKVEVKE